ncbi:MAG: radical SAM protein [Melioribacteraceae bacterium]|nr:radical SAM protein [Melioribacteraceae bacterium]
MLPSYLEKLTINDLIERSVLLNNKLASCNICPNECNIDRKNSNEGKCRSGTDIIISGYGPHYGEEPPLVGKFGSGTIFFTNCNMACVFCQNYDISHLGRGSYCSVEQLADIMILLQDGGCHNINLVSPTHFISQIVSALVIAVEKGLEIPIVYNCGGYESVETLQLLRDIVDIYMPDIKYSDNEFGGKFSEVIDYWDVVRSAVSEMYSQVGDLHIKPNGVTDRGLLIRHLVLPNNLAGTQKVLEFIRNEISIETYINIMDQYRPAFQAGKYKELNRAITNDEFIAALDKAKSLGLHRGFEY